MAYSVEEQVAVDSEEDSDGEEPPSPLAPPPATRKQRSSVSAEAFGAWNKRVTYLPPVYDKTPEQTALLCQVLSSSFLTSSLESHDLEVVVGAMKGPCFLEPVQRIIREGDDGDHLYVVTEGFLDCSKVIDGVDTVVHTCVPGDIFGELALLYSCPRRASVTSREASVVWELDRETFNYIVLEGVIRKRNQCSAMLRRVPLFQAMPDGDIENIIDAMKQVYFPAGHVIIQQGDPGEHFFFVYSGQVVATKECPDVEPVSMAHQAGDYFGELALLWDAPRAATVVSSTEVCLMSMDRATFKRLMGPVEGFLERETARYE
jgi:cAMP-dependent protein kinase regulator